MMFDSIKALSLTRELILASGSPRRLQLLTKTKVIFTQKVSEVDESPIKAEDPFSYAIRISEAKALIVAGLYDNNHVILAGDTVVTFDGLILGKPQSKEEAAKMLTLLSGREHTVCTALAFAERDRLIISDYEKTLVRFNQVTEKQILEYIETGESEDKAGAYGIQGMGAFLVDSIDGSLDNVIGLPLTLLERLAKETGDILKHGTKYK